MDFDFEARCCGAAFLCRGGGVTSAGEDSSLSMDSRSSAPSVESLGLRVEVVLGAIALRDYD